MLTFQNIDVFALFLIFIVWTLFVVVDCVTNFDFLLWWMTFVILN